MPELDARLDDERDDPVEGVLKPAFGKSRAVDIMGLGDGIRGRQFQMVKRVRGAAGDRNLGPDYIDRARSPRFLSAASASRAARVAVS